LAKESLQRENKMEGEVMGGGKKLRKLKTGRRRKNSWKRRKGFLQRGKKRREITEGCETNAVGVSRDATGEG